MRALSLQDAGLECTFHGIDLLTDCCLSNFTAQTSRQGQRVQRLGARIIGVPDAIGNRTLIHLARPPTALFFYHPLERLPKEQKTGLAQCLSTTKTMPDIVSERLHTAGWRYHRKGSVGDKSQLNQKLCTGCTQTI